MAEPIISVSGLRGIVGESLTPDVALRYACAAVAQASPGPIVLGNDGRASAALLTDAVSAGLQAIGRTVIPAGVCATPTVGVLVRELAAAGGIQITASHNPPEYNGLKVFSDEGRVLTAASGQRALQAYRSNAWSWAPYDRLGRVAVCVDPGAFHLQRILSIVDVARIRARKFRVLLDCNHGAGSALAPRLLEELGCETIVLGGRPDGQYAHPPEPTADNLAGVAEQVRAAGVDVAFCLDPDADRLALIDERGVYPGEEYTLALCADHVLEDNPGPVVTNCASSRMLEDVALKHRVPFFRSAVGEANVVEQMETHEAALGGEGNGGVIDPRVVLVRDSLTGLALVLDLLAAGAKKLSELIAALPRYEIVKAKFNFPRERLPAALAALRAEFPAAEADEQDGLRLDWPDRWLLLRGSNTEPIVRAIAEAPSRETAEQLCAQAGKILAAVQA